MSEISFAAREAALSLLSAQAVRERAHEILQAARADELAHFRLHEERLPAIADLVADVIRERYPRLDVPLHARWRHFVWQGHDLWQELALKTAWPDAAAKARAAFDLAIISVLLDAGAGPGWTYHDAATGAKAGRSEGLALASLRMFEQGLFSSCPDDPLRADADALAAMTAERLAEGFQVRADNPLAGLEGRARLLARLGAVLAAKPEIFALADDTRPGGLFDHLRKEADDAPLRAEHILRALLLHLGGIWPERLSLGGVALGDVWRHPAIRRDDATDGLMPIHKLSQWLAYSLIEPLQDAGVKVEDISGLTGLAEYRNGGLFVDGGVLALRDAQAAAGAHAVDSVLVVEWRALTVALLDVVAPLVRERLGVSEARFPLGCVLEGGTWAAGRKLARQARPDASPPISVISDGTVF